MRNRRTKRYFTTPREKRYWLYAAVVIIGIFFSLSFGEPIIKVFGSHSAQVILFLLGLALTGGAIVMEGLKVRLSKAEISTGLGLVAVFIMFIFRLEAAERSHIIEYSVLAIFIYKAIVERLNPVNHFLKPGLFAFLATFVVGVVDECIQLFLPYRVFDPQDIVFNTLAALMGIGGSMILQWIRKKFSRL